jgi:hypothetical protein
MEDEMKDERGGKRRQGWMNGWLRVRWLMGWMVGWSKKIVEWYYNSLIQVSAVQSQAFNAIEVGSTMKRYIHAKVEDGNHRWTLGR